MEIITYPTIRDVVVITNAAAAAVLFADGSANATVNAIPSQMTVTDGVLDIKQRFGRQIALGLASDGVTVSNSTFGIDGEGLAAGNKGYGVGFAGGSNHAQNNTIGGNDL